MGNDDCLIFEAYKGSDLITEQYNEWWDAKMQIDELKPGYYIGYQSGSVIKINEKEYKAGDTVRGMNFPFVLRVQRNGKVFKHYIPNERG